jgi:flavin reductase (DIM6/NTAB) family NADH-FMN oxidoreductase RutF
MRTITPSPRALTAVERNAAVTREADLFLARARREDVLLEARRTDTFPAAAALAAALEEFAQAAAQLPGQPATPLIVQVGDHTVAMQLTQDAADGLARWIHHAAGAAKNQALIVAAAQAALEAETRSTRRAGLHLVPAGGAA